MIKKLFFVPVLFICFLASAALAIGPYSDNGETIYDQSTGLTWQQNTGDINNDNVITPSGDKVPWTQALSYCENLILSGRDDWRMPNIRELVSIADYTRVDPSIDPVFQCEWNSDEWYLDDYYWSSTSAYTPPDEESCCTNSNKAWSVWFRLGDTLWNSKNGVHKSYVRCVRGGGVVSSKEVDTDGDGLPDEWEKYGVDGVDLKALGADPLRKDIFVYYDWFISPFHDHDPHNLVAVIDAFAKQGISLHIVRGQAINEGLAHIVIDNWEEFDAIKSSFFPDEYRRIFHYCLFGHKIWPNADGGYPSGISKNLTDFRAGASDFIVALSDWENYLDGQQKDIKYRYYIYSGTFMHELGHNLGLGHGGMEVDEQGNITGRVDHTLFKPNHLSVMNYAFQTRGIDIGENFPTLDYSKFTHDDINFLNEDNLNENIVIGKTIDKLSMYKSFYFCDGSNDRIEISSLFEKIDWNCNDNNNDVSVSASINRDDLHQLLTTSNEWNNLVYNGGSIGIKETSLYKASLDALNYFPFNELAFDEDVTWGPYIPGPNNFPWPMFLPAINRGK